MERNLRETLKRPIVAVPGALASVVTVLDPTWLLVLFETVIANSGTLFAATSIFATTVAPNVAEIAHYSSALVGVMVVLAVIHGGKMLNKVYNDYTEEIDDT